MLTKPSDSTSFKSRAVIRSLLPYRSAIFAVVGKIDRPLFTFRNDSRTRRSVLSVGLIFSCSIADLTCHDGRPTIGRNWFSPSPWLVWGATFNPAATDDIKTSY